MVIEEFPNPEDTTEDGIVALGGDLDPESLILAYSQGIFPWPIEGLPLPWFCPPVRAVLQFSELRTSRSLKKAQRKAGLSYTIDRDFRSVIEACSERPREKNTWITPEMKDAYIRLHELGYAHSVEVWANESLVGGLYGVSVLGTFAGESMFHRESDASKLALLFLVDHLRARGLEWIDIQMLTPHLEAMGAKEINRREFLDLLHATQSDSRILFESF